MAARRRRSLAESSCCECKPGGSRGEGVAGRGSGGSGTARRAALLEPWAAAFRLGLGLCREAGRGLGRPPVLGAGWRGAVSLAAMLRHFSCFPDAAPAGGAVHAAAAAAAGAVHAAAAPVDVAALLAPGGRAPGRLGALEAQFMADRSHSSALEARVDALEAKLRAMEQKPPLPVVQPAAKGEAASAGTPCRSQRPPPRLRQGGGPGTSK